MQIPPPTPPQVMDALLDGNDDFFLLDNLINSAMAGFNLAQASPLDTDIKMVFHQLEQRFRLYSRLMGGDREL